MTTRLYYTDSMQQTFTSRVARCDIDGAQPRVVLESTAFYPTSGGQPYDLGTLGGATVRDVVDDDAWGVVHVVDRPLVVGETVEVVVDGLEPGEEIVVRGIVRLRDGTPVVSDDARAQAAP